MNLSYREIYRKLPNLKEPELWDLINEELKNTAPRVTVIERLHMRASMLRTTRERLQLLQAATSSTT
mgnify:CR=1 FL=1